ncbi:MAG TPA: MMPL family transporter, partial [Bdellovibrionota bacterium]|nr:MMPL family transporter [Bdellovibrionota bacterium]
DLPKGILERFREKDGTVGKLVLVSPVFAPELILDVRNQLRFIDEVRGVADSVEPGAPAVGQLPLTVDVFRSIQHDGPRVTLLSFALVSLLVIVLFRRLSRIVLCLVSLVLGVTWLAGTAIALDLKINFMNFIVLPITFGIGVDYGVNILQRYWQDGRGTILTTVRETGGAVALSSLTTIIGYGSLLIAGNQGLVSFGRLAVLGEITCVAAALLALPALLRMMEARARQAAVIPEREAPEERRTA